MKYNINNKKNIYFAIKVLVSIFLSVLFLNFISLIINKLSTGIISITYIFVFYMIIILLFLFLHKLILMYYFYDSSICTKKIKNII